MGYELDTYFIEKAHKTSPRRLYSQTGADWQYRVDFERLRQERLQKTRDQIEAFDLGALVLYAGANIRYVTGSYQGNWKYNINIRYVVLPRGGEFTDIAIAQQVQLEFQVIQAHGQPGVQLQGPREYLGSHLPAPVRERRTDQRIEIDQEQRAGDAKDQQGFPDQRPTRPLLPGERSFPRATGSRRLSS